MKALEETVTLKGKKNITVEKFFADESFVSNVGNGAFSDKLACLTDCYREIFAFDPWNEYLKCSDRSCTGKAGAGELIASQGMQPSTDIRLVEQEEDGLLPPERVCCPKCGAAMELFYPPDRTRERFTAEFQKNITGVLLWDEHRRLSGFTFGWITNYQDLWDEKLETACGGTPSYAEYKSSLLKTGKDIHNPVFYLAEWGLSRRLRGSGASALLLEKLRDVSVSHLTEWVDTTDVVNYSRAGSKPYVLMEALSAQRLYDNGATVLSWVRTPVLLQGLDLILSSMLAQPNTQSPSG